MKEYNHAISCYIERIGQYSQCHPLRFGQMLTIAAYYAGYEGDLFYITDEKLIKGLQAWEKKLKADFQ